MERGGAGQATFDVAPDNAAGGECNYTTLPTYPPPGMGECTVPDWVPK